MILLTGSRVISCNGFKSFVFRNSNDRLEYLKLIYQESMVLKIINQRSRPTNRNAMTAIDSSPLNIVLKVCAWTTLIPSGGRYIFCLSFDIISMDTQHIVVNKKRILFLMVNNCTFFSTNQPMESNQLILFSIYLFI